MHGISPLKHICTVVFSCVHVIFGEEGGIDHLRVLPSNSNPEEVSFE